MRNGTVTFFARLYIYIGFSNVYPNADLMFSNFWRGFRNVTHIPYLLKKITK